MTTASARVYPEPSPPVTLESDPQDAVESNDFDFRGKQAEVTVPGQETWKEILKERRSGWEVSSAQI